MMCLARFSFFFFFNDLAPTEISTLPLHAALPISVCAARATCWPETGSWHDWPLRRRPPPDPKSTRLNSSHLVISYAVFCLKKKKKKSNVPDLRHQCVLHNKNANT